MRNRYAYFILAVFSLLLLACGGGGGDADAIPPPAPPQSVLASSGNSQVALSWGKVTGATAYRIYWSTTAGVSKETGSMISSVTNTYAHTGLTNGATYYYVVAAVNQSGESAESKEVSAMPSVATPPLPPVSVMTHASNRTVNIAWTAGESAEAAATSYNIYWSVSSDVTKANGIRISGVNSPYMHTNLINDTKYYYIVTGVNAYGEGNASQEVSAIPTRGNIPLAPTGLTAVADKLEATISWNAVGGALSYNIYWSTSSNVSSQNGTKIEGVKSPYTHSGLSKETTYYYVVTAVNGYGESEESDKASVMILNPVPPAPTGLKAAAGKFQATISWNAVVEATSYNIYWSTSSVISSQKGTKIENVKSPYTHSGLDEDTTYYYVATAVNGYGESEDSAKASVMIVSTRKDIFVAMGDSITAGFPLSNYNDSYVARLSRTWGKTAVNEGVDGTKSSYGTALIESVLNEHNPRYLTLYYGSNDLGFYDNDTIINNLRFVIIKAKENGTNPVVATLGPFFGQWAWRQPLAIELNKKIRKMAAEEGVAYADLEAALNGNSAYINADGMHPNSAGHAIIANTFYSARPR
jgi:lysophospholipase L1-like esterase